LSIAIIPIKARPHTVAELARIPMALAWVELPAFPLSDNRKLFEQRAKAHHGLQRSGVAMMQRKRE
jgi:hypothetical protein